MAAAEHTFEFEMLDEDDQTVTVTQTARWQSSWLVASG